MSLAEKNMAREGKVDIREDEDQSVKLSQIVELLVAAGYFRARIKGLSPFDKIVGGLTWCIETCNFDVDVDLLFSENLTIGQKIALTERIVRVVQSMKCPHRLEPHQIQGLDAINIFPVVQWLVKKALETREEFGDVTRTYSNFQFARHYTTPREDAVENTWVTVAGALSRVQGGYGPRRRWRRRGAGGEESRGQRVQTTLMEYGRPAMGAGLKRSEGGDDVDGGTEQMDDVEALMQTMDLTDAVEGRLSAQHVGSIVGSRVGEITATSQHYSQLHQQMNEEILGDSASSHARTIKALETQRSALANQLAEHQLRAGEGRGKVEEVEARLRQVVEERDQLVSEIQQLGIVDSKESDKVLHQLTQLVAENEAVRKKESEFKDACRKESERLKQEISTLQNRLQESTPNADLQERFTAEQDKYHRMRRQLAKKTRQVEALRRVIDDVPGRAELSQYQRRFVELYNQVGATHRETQQFYNMYNTLTDTRTYMDKELSLLNSILDNMAAALSNPANMDEYLHQLETIVDGINQNKAKLQRKYAEEKTRRNLLSDDLSALQEVNRRYANTVHLLGHEIRRNEVLNQKIAQTQQ